MLWRAASPINTSYTSNVIPDEDPVNTDGFEVQRLRQELARLQALMGPDERSYEGLVADLSACEQATMIAEQQAGQLRGEIAEVKVQLGRARQEQEWALAHRRPMALQVSTAMQRIRSVGLSTVRRTKSLWGNARAARKRRR